MLGFRHLCVKQGSTNTSWHISIHYVKNFTHTQSGKLKHNGGIYGLDGWEIYGLNGWGIYGLNGWDIYGLNGSGIYDLNGWGIYSLNGRGSYGTSKLLFLGRYAQKHWFSEEYPFWSLHDTDSVPLNKTKKAG